MIRRLIVKLSVSVAPCLPVAPVLRIETARVSRSRRRRYFVMILRTAAASGPDGAIARKRSP